LGLRWRYSNPPPRVVTCERYIYMLHQNSQALLSWSVRNFFVPTDCRFVAFDTVSYRTTCEQNVLFLLYQDCLKKSVVKVAVNKTQVYEWHKRFRDGHETAGFFCTTKHQRIGSIVGSHRVRCRAECEGIGASAIFLGLVTGRLTPVFATKKCPRMTTIRCRRRSHCKSDDSTWQTYRKWFPGMLAEALRTCHCPRKLLWRKFYVNRCNVI
jgi:hypothetical protein